MEGKDEAEQEEEKNKVRTVKLEINKRKACFSEAEISFFKESVMEGHVSRTHFTDPSLEYCYCCPPCDRVINGENLSQSIKIHFEIAHGQSTRTYDVTTNHGQHQFTIAPAKITGKCREGAQPPSSKELQEKGTELEETRRSKNKKRPHDDSGKKATEEEDTKGKGKKKLKKRSLQYKEKQKESKQQEPEKKGKIRYKGRKHKRQQAEQAGKVKEKALSSTDIGKDVTMDTDNKKTSPAATNIRPEDRDGEKRQAQPEEQSNNSKGGKKGQTPEGSGGKSGLEGSKQPSIRDYLDKLREDREKQEQAQESTKEVSGNEGEKQPTTVEEGEKKQSRKEAKESTDDDKNIFIGNMQEASE